MQDETGYCDYTALILNKYEVHEYIIFKDFLVEQKRELGRLPRHKGIYFVIYPLRSEPDNNCTTDFLEAGTGGYFKGRNSNVSIETLCDKWVEDADILYIGKAGGTTKKGKESNETLHKRVKALLRFGNGDPVSHWGGRYLWQHRNSQDFRIYWYSCAEDENPVILESQLLSDFVNHYGKLPFANLKGGETL